MQLREGSGKEGITPVSKREWVCKRVRGARGLKEEKGEWRADLLLECRASHLGIEPRTPERQSGVLPLYQRDGGWKEVGAFTL